MKKLFTLSLMTLVTLAFSYNAYAQGEASESSEIQAERLPASTGDFPAHAGDATSGSSAGMPETNGAVTPTRTPAQIEQDKEVMERAKARKYKGGAEEGELRVQAQLPKAQRKIAPVVDRKETDKDTQDHD